MIVLKVRNFWEANKIWKKIYLMVCTFTMLMSKQWGRFFLSLCASQKVRTLIMIWVYYFSDSGPFKYYISHHVFDFFRPTHQPLWWRNTLMVPSPDLNWFSVQSQILFLNALYLNRSFLEPYWPINSARIT